MRMPAAQLAAMCDRLMTMSNDEPELAEIWDAVLYFCGEYYDEIGNYEKILQSNAKINEENTRVREAMLFQRASALTKLKRYEAAREAYLSCSMESDEMRAVVMGNIGDVWLAEGNLSRAIASYREALAVKPDYAFVWFGLSAALLREGDWEGSKAAYLQGIWEDPVLSYWENSYFVPESEAVYQRACHAYSGERYREAKFYLEKSRHLELNAVYREALSVLMARVEEALSQTSVHQYPVLLDNVQQMAVDEGGRYAVLSEIASAPDGESIETRIWVMDMATERVYRRARFVHGMPRGLAFVPGTTKVRVLWPEKRVEMDVRQETGEIYFYENNAAWVRELKSALTADGESIVSYGCLRDDDACASMGLKASHWLDPYSEAVIDSSGEVYRALYWDAEHRRLIAETQKNIVMFDGVSQTTKVILRHAPDRMSVSRIAGGYAIGIEKGVIMVNEKGDIERFLGMPSSVLAVSSGRDGKIYVLYDHVLEVRELD